jgi:hypothetical protein
MVLTGQNEAGAIHVKVAAEVSLEVPRTDLAPLASALRPVGELLTLSRVLKGVSE